MQVIKRDGSVEDFDRGKLLVSMIAAGATPEQAEEGVKMIEGWIQAQTGSVSTLVIRTRVAEYLKAQNPMAAGQYASYHKPA